MAANNSTRWQKDNITSRGQTFTSETNRHVMHIAACTKSDLVTISIWPNIRKAARHCKVRHESHGMNVVTLIRDRYLYFTYNVHKVQMRKEKRISVINLLCFSPFRPSILLGFYFSRLLFNTTQNPDNKMKRLYGVKGVLYSPAYLYKCLC